MVELKSLSQHHTEVLRNVKNTRVHKYISSSQIRKGYLKIQEVAPQFCSKYWTKNTSRKHDFHKVRSFLNSCLFLSSLIHSEGISYAPFPEMVSSRTQYWQSVLKVCHPRCVRSIIQSCSVYISICAYSHEHNNITFSSHI